MILLLDEMGGASGRGQGCHLETLPLLLLLHCPCYWLVVYKEIQTAHWMSRCKPQTRNQPTGSAARTWPAHSLVVTRRKRTCALAALESRSCMTLFYMAAKGLPFQISSTSQALKPNVPSPRCSASRAYPPCLSVKRA
jgi:hypothetical protein